MSNTKKIKRIAIVADDNQRSGLIEWSYFNRNIISRYEVIAYETTAELLKGTLNIPITLIASDSGDGYRELVKLVQNNEVDILIFFGSMFKEDTHQPGVPDLLVIANRQNIVTANNRATANFIIKGLEADVELIEDTEPFVPKTSIHEPEGGKSPVTDSRANFIGGSPVYSRLT